MKASVLAVLLRPSRGQLSTVVLPVTAFAAVTALILTVVGGAQSFWAWTDEYAGFYQLFAAIALVLLLLPLATLGGAAARLSARRRDERLSTLRLLGVSPAGVAGVTIAESTMLALVGAAAGVIVHLVTSPLIGLIPFRGAPLGTASVVLPPGQIALVGAGVVLLAAVSATVALRKVVISPLGVRTRTDAPRVHWLRGVIAVVVVGAGVLVLQFLPAGGGIAFLVIAIAGVFGAGLAVLNLVGPWAVRVAANTQLRRADRTEKLLAARMILESPKTAWRHVGGVAMTSFMAVIAGSGVALLGLASGADLASRDRELFADIRTGLIITLVASFVMVAVSVSINQASDVIDNTALHRSLHYLGVPMDAVQRARRRAVMSPLLVASIGSAACGAALVLPLVGLSLLFAPLSMATILGVLVLGVVLVWASTWSTTPLLKKAFAPA